jgi:choline-sulfatase
MHHGQVARMRMIRTPEWKLVRHFKPEGQDELYHLADDAGETRNLVSSSDPGHRAQRDELARRLEGWMSRIGDNAATQK